jgi:hypothetical protein
MAEVKPRTLTEVKFFDLATVAIAPWRISLPSGYNAARLLGLRVQLNAPTVSLGFPLDPNFSATLYTSSYSDITDNISDPGSAGWIDQVWMGIRAIAYEPLAPTYIGVFDTEASTSYYVSRAPLMANIERLRIAFGGAELVGIAGLVTVYLTYRIEFIDEFILAQATFGNVRS